MAKASTDGSGGRVLDGFLAEYWAGHHRQMISRPIAFHLSEPKGLEICDNVVVIIFMPLVFARGAISRCDIICSGLTPERKWSKGFATLEKRFEGLIGSQLTDLALYIYAVDENATYKIVEKKADGTFLELTNRTDGNQRKNPKGDRHYKGLFLNGGYGNFQSGTMIGMSPKEPWHEHAKGMVSGGTRTRHLDIS